MRKPKVVTVAGQKGGIGKTLLVLTLAEAWRARGYRVLVIDADDPKQRSASVWSEVAAERGLGGAPVVRVGTDLLRQLAELGRGYDVVLIDTPGHLEPPVVRMLEASDLALLPCGEDGLEVWAMSMATAPVVQKARTYARGLDAAIVFTCISVDRSTDRRIDQLTARLSECGIGVAKTVVHRRKPYANAITVGKVVQTYKPRSKAALEVARLAREIETRLGLTRGSRAAVERSAPSRVRVEPQRNGARAKPARAPRNGRRRDRATVRARA